MVLKKSAIVTILLLLFIGFSSHAPVINYDSTSDSENAWKRLALNTSISNATTVKATETLNTTQAINSKQHVPSFLPKQSTAAYFTQGNQQPQDFGDLVINYEQISDGFVQGTIGIIGSEPTTFSYYEDQTGLYEIDYEGERHLMIAYPLEVGAVQHYDITHKSHYPGEASTTQSSVSVKVLNGDSKKVTYEISQTMSFEGQSYSDTTQVTLQSQKGFVMTGEYLLYNGEVEHAKPLM